jgi:hypothetical protein
VSVSHQVGEILRKLACFVWVLSLLSTSVTAQGGGQDGANTGAGQNAQRQAGANSGAANGQAAAEVNPNVSSAIDAGANAVRTAATNAGANPKEADKLANAFTSSATKGVEAAQANGNQTLGSWNQNGTPNAQGVFAGQVHDDILFSWAISDSSVSAPSPGFMTAEKKAKEDARSNAIATAAANAAFEASKKVEEAYNAAAASGNNAAQPTPASNQGHGNQILGGQAQPQGAGQTGQPALTDAQVNQIVDLARRQAIQKYLEALTTNIKQTQRRDNAGTRVTPRTSVAWRDPNGNPVSLPTVEALILVQQMAIKQLTNARSYANQVQNMTPAEKQQLIAQLRQQAAVVGQKFQAFQAAQDQINSVPGGEKGVREKYTQFANQAAQLDEQSKLETAQGQTQLAAQHTAESQRLRTELAGGDYRKFMNARAAYYQALSANPLLGVQLPDESGLFYQTVLQNSDITLLPTLYDAAGQLATQYTEQIDRISRMDTVEALWELAGPQYALARAMAAASGGEATQRLVDALEATYAGTQAVAGFQKALEDTVISMGQALPVVGLAFTAISIYRDGEDYVIALSDEKNAQAMAPAMGYQGVIETGQRVGDTGSKLAWNVALTAPQIPGLISALQTGKNVKLVYNFGGKAATVGAEANAVKAVEVGAGAAVDAAKPVVSEVPSGAVRGVRTATGATNPASALNPQAAEGLEIAKNLGLKDVQTYVDTIANPAIENSQLAAGAAEAATKNLMTLTKIEEAQAAARAAGLPQARIDEIINKARSAGTISAYADVPRDLEVAKFVNDGNVILVDVSRNAEAADYFKGLGVTVTDTTVATNLMGLKQEINFAAKNGRLLNLTPAQRALLENTVVPKGNDILKWYTTIGNETQQIFDQDFINNLKKLLDQSAKAGNANSARLLNELQWSTLESASTPDKLPTFPATPEAAAITPGANAVGTGTASLSPNQIARMSDDQLQHIGRAQFATYDQQTQQAIYQELQNRGLTPKYAGGPVTGSLPLAHNQQAQQLAGTVKKLSNEDLTKLANKLASDPNADPLLKSAIQNEIEQRAQAPSGVRTGPGDTQVLQPGEIKNAKEGTPPGNANPSASNAKGISNAAGSTGTPGIGALASGAAAINSAGGSNAGNAPGSSVNSNSCDCNLGQLLRDFQDARDREAEAENSLNQARATANADQDAMSAAGNALATAKGTQADLNAAIEKNQASQAALQKAQADYANAQQAAAAAEQAYDTCLHAKENCPPPANTANGSVNPNGGNNSIGNSGNGQQVTNTPMQKTVQKDEHFTPAANAPELTSPDPRARSNGTIPGGGPSSGVPEIPPNPPVPPAPNAAAANGLPIIPDKPLPQCWPAGTDIKAACKAWLDIAEHNEVAAQLAQEALADAQSDLNQADRLDASAQQWDEHSQKLSAYSAMYASDAQTYEQKAAGAFSNQSAAQWQQMAADATQQSNNIAAQAAAAAAQANQIRQEAQALRNKVQSEKADLETKKNAALASRNAYNACVALPACPTTENSIGAIGGGAPIAVVPTATTVPNTPTGQFTYNFTLPNFAIDGTNTALSGILVPTIQYIAVSGIGIQNAHAVPREVAPDRTWATSSRPRIEVVSLRSRNPLLAFGLEGLMPARERRDAQGSAGKVVYSIVANGNSSGQALELQVFDPSGATSQIGLPEGVVLEPIKVGSAKPLSETMNAGSLLKKNLVAYCVEYMKLPPEAGMLYRLAPPNVQNKFSSIQPVLQAGRQLAAAGKLHPDSDPQAYEDSIRQYSIWTQIENWSEQQFGQVFVEKTKENAAAAKVKWTKQMEQALNGLVPGRWRDISMVLDEAGKLSKTPSGQGPR